MSSSPQQAKADLRRRMKAAVAAVTPAELTAASRAVCDRLIASAPFAPAQTVMLFHPMPGEIDLAQVAAECARQGKTLCLPRVDWTGKEMHAAAITRWATGLAESRPGVLGPADDAQAVPAASLDLIAVPGLSFDPAGGRLGRGAGFYDRFLAGLTAFKVGVGLDSQVVQRVEMEAWDVRLDAVATPTRWIECR